MNEQTGKKHRLNVVICNELIDIHFNKITNLLFTPSKCKSG